jgi:GT2 family glycosyltransferase
MPEAAPFLTVVMPVRNGMPFLTAQLEALANQDYLNEWQLVVADNGSSDASRAEAELFADRLPIEIVDAADVAGVASVRNRGAEHAAGRSILFCDCDDVADRGWLSAMAAALADAQLVGGGLELDRLNGSVARGSSWVTSFDLDGPWRYLPTVIGCNMAVDAEAFRAVGGFDVRFKGVAEDNDVSWRLQRAGYTVAFAPDAVMHYRLRSGLRALLRQGRIYGHGSAQLAAFYADIFRPDSLADVLRTALWVSTRSANLALGTNRRRSYLRSLAHLWGQIQGSREFGFLYISHHPPKKRQP